MLDNDLKIKIILSILFLSSSIVAHVVMVFSPEIPLRALAGSHFFLLIAISFLLNIVSTEKNVMKVLPVYVLATIIFVWSYILVLSSYRVTKYQEQIRNSHINYEKLLYGEKATPTIPSYYFMHLLRKYDKFDMYHSRFMASWFGVKKIDLVWIDYDCSAKDRGKEITAINETELGEAKVFVVEKNFLFSDGTIMLESNNDIDRNIFIAYYTQRGNDLKKIKLGGKIKIKDRYYLGATVHGLKEVENVKITYN